MTVISMLVEVLCSDPGCAERTEVVVARVEHAAAELCAGCGHAVEVVRVSDVVFLEPFPEIRAAALPRAA